MNTTRLSSKGQVVIPKQLRAFHHWEAGQELEVIDVGDGILLRPKRPFEETSIRDVASCLKYKGKPISLDDMDAAISKGIRNRYK